MAEVSLRRKNAETRGTEWSVLHVTSGASKPGRRSLDCAQQERNRFAWHRQSRFNRTFGKPRLHSAGQLGRGSSGGGRQIRNTSLHLLIRSAARPRGLNVLMHRKLSRKTSHIYSLLL